MTVVYELAKRVMDVSIAAVALTILSLPLLFIALMIPRRIGPGSPFFKQTRPGRNGRPFTVIKFRSMRDEYDRDGRLQSDLERTPPFGWFLRRRSIDEVPQLINVLKGEMSLVGPRPLLMEYLDRYPPEFRRRHDVLPGITGWAQINGRDFTTFRQRLELDVWYVDNRSLLLDLRILLLTLRLVLFKPQIAPLDQNMDEIDDLGLHPDAHQGASHRPGANGP